MTAADLTCRTCGGSDFAAWYPQDERQTIALTRDAAGALEVLYTGATRSGESGPDEQYDCLACGDSAATIGELIGEPAPDREHDWHGAYCSTCGADEASSFAAGPCQGFEPAASPAGDVCSRLVAFETEADRYVAASGRVAVRVETAARESGETDPRVLALAAVLDRAREHERLAREYGDAEPREHGAQLRAGAVRLALAIEAP